MSATQGLSPFARLFRSSAVAEAAAKAADEDARKLAATAAATKAAEDDEEDDDAKKARAKAEEDEKKKKDDEAKKAKAKAEEDEKKKKDEEDEEARKKAKRSKSEGDDDSDKDDEKDASASAARARERGRIEAIMMSDAAAANPTAALHMAVHTATPRRAAIGMLTAFAPVASAIPANPSATRETARKRLESVEVPDVGGNDPAPATGAGALAAQIIAAGRKRRGETA